MNHKPWEEANGILGMLKLYTRVSAKRGEFSPSLSHQISTKHFTCINIILLNVLVVLSTLVVLWHNYNKCFAELKSSPFDRFTIHFMIIK